ncbi:MAG: hypothetical protein Q8942_09340 [Bacillota bacterium]|nr:hypothetical protein [Bacillota bacterium]
MKIITHYNQTYKDPDFDPKCDLNDDGSINMKDVIYLTNYFNKIITNPDVSPTDSPVHMC